MTDLLQIGGIHDFRFLFGRPLVNGLFLAGGSTDSGGIERGGGKRRGDGLVSPSLWVVADEASELHHVIGLDVISRSTRRHRQRGAR